MEWYNAQKDQLPENGQQVLISVKGVYYICRFDEKERSFIINEETKKTIYKIDEYLIYWTHFEDPDF